MNKKIIGIDLGGTTIKFGVLSVDGKLESKWTIDTNIAENGRYIVSDIVKSIQEYLITNSLTTDDIFGIGMGSPGQIDYEKGTVRGAYNLGWAEEQEIKSVIESEIGVPFAIDNDANAAALGEAWIGAGDNKPDVIFITLGTGVGGGVIINRKLVHGSRGAAGEIGHMLVDSKGFTCTCGNVGCLETVASATGIVNLANKYVNDFEETNELVKLVKEGKASAKEVFDYAKSGDKYGTFIVDEFAKYLGKTCSQLANALNPNYIVIGGGVSAAGEYLLEKVNNVYLEYAFPTVRISTELKLASLGNDAGIIGAASLILK